MGQSARFKSLKRRIAELETNLLPPPRATGRYTKEEYDRIRAFRVLAHAEIEACLEDLAFDVADTAYRGWAKDGRSRRPIIGMLGYHAGALEVRSILSPRGAPPEQLANVIERARNEFCGRARYSNNGILEEDVLALLLPLGLQLADLDNTWLATTNSFGRNRGETAHKSAIKAAVLPDPSSERSIVQQVVEGLAAVDQKLAGLRW